MDTCCSCYCLIASGVSGPKDCSPQAPLSMGFSSQEYWSGFPFPSPGDFPNPGIEPGFLPCRQILYHWANRKAPSTHISPPYWASFTTPSHPLGHHRARSWAPRATWQLPTSCVFHTRQYIYVSATLSVHPTLSFPPFVHKSVLYVWVSIPALQNRLISTIFKSDLE